MRRIRRVILDEATQSMVASLREICRGLPKSERVRVWGYYAKWQAKRRQESLDVVYVATYNKDGNGKSEKDDEAIPI